MNSYWKYKFVDGTIKAQKSYFISLNMTYYAQEKFHLLPPIHFVRTQYMRIYGVYLSISNL